MGRVDELRAELEVAELEEKLEKAKGTKAGPSRELKAEVREARRAYRAARDGLELVTDDRGRITAVEPEGADDA